MADCCLIKKVATVEVYENKNEVRAYGFMAGDRNTPVMEVRFKHLWGESNLSSCKLRWIIVDDVGSLLVGEVPIQSDNTALINLPNELFTGDRRMKVQLTVASCDGERILNLQQFTDLKVINSLAPNEVVEPVYQILINAIYDESQKYLKELETSYTQKYGSLDSLYKSARASLEQYLITAENGGNAEFLQGYSPAHFQKVENTINDLIASTKYDVGDVVEVLGYYSAGDGSHHKRIAKAEDDGSGELGVDGLIWCILHNGEVTSSWFGCKKSDFSDSELNSLIAYIKNKDNGVLCVKVDSYIKTKSTIDLTDCNSIVIKGLSGRKYSSFNDLNNLCGFGLFGENAYIDCLDSFSLTFRDLFFNHEYVNDTQPMQTLLFGRSGYVTSMGHIIERCEFRGHVQTYNIIFAGAEVNIVKECIAITGGKCKGIIANLTKNIGIVSKIKTLQTDQDLVSATANQYIDNTFELYSQADDSSIFFTNTGNCNTRIQGGFYYNKKVNESQKLSRFLEIKLYNNAPNLNLSVEGIRREGNGMEFIKVHGTKSGIYLNGLCIKNNFTVPSSGSKLFHVDNNVSIEGLQYEYNGIFDVTGEIPEDGGEINIPKLLFSKILLTDGQLLNTNSAIGCDIILRKKSTTLENLLKNYKPTYELHDFRGSRIQNGAGSSFNFTSNGTVDIIRKYGISDNRPTKTQPFIELEDCTTFMVSNNKTIFYNKTNKSWYYADGTLAYSDTSLYNGEISYSLKSLDTPYYTRKMEEEGIYDDYVAYRDELHEYENSRTTDETMLLPVLQEPVIPESVKAFAEKYKLI